MDEPADSIVSRHLGRDEKLLWAGQPRRGMIFRASDALAILSGLFVLIFMLFWMAMATFAAVSATIADDGPPAVYLIWLFPLFGLPFVLVGLYLAGGRLWLDARIRCNTCYGITNERAIIISGLFSRKIQTIDLGTVSDITLTENADGCGTIQFGPRSPFEQFAGAFGSGSFLGMPGSGPNGFEQIEDAKRVYDLIRDIQRASPQATTTTAAPPSR